MAQIAIAVNEERPHVSILISVMSWAFKDALTSTTYENGIKLLSKLKASKNFNQLGEALVYA